MESVLEGGDQLGGSGIVLENFSRILAVAGLVPDGIE